MFSHRCSWRNLLKSVQAKIIFFTHRNLWFCTHLPLYFSRHIFDSPVPFLQYYGIHLYLGLTFPSCLPQSVHNDKNKTIIILSMKVFTSRIIVNESSGDIHVIHHNHSFVLSTFRTKTIKLSWERS